MNHWIIQGIYLLGSGVVAAAGFVLFALGGTFNLSTENATSFLLIVAVHALAVTAGVFGSDRRILSLTTDKADGLRYSRAFILWNFFVAVLLALYLNYTYRLPFFISAGLAVAAYLDTFSVITQTLLSTKSRSEKVLRSNLLRYPLFFITIYAAGFAAPLDLKDLSIAFLTSSTIRAFYLRNIVRKQSTTSKITIELNVNIGAYQIVNYSIFRGGQLAAGLPFLSTNPSMLAYMLLSWKVIELIDKTLVYLMPAILGYLRQISNVKQKGLTAALGLLSLSAFYLSHIILDFASHDLTTTLLLILHAALLAPTNIAVINRYKDHEYPYVLRSGLLSLCITIAGCTLLITLSKDLVALAAWTPLSLLVLNSLLWRNLRQSKGAT